jgi:hypothetical protein
MKPDDWKGEDKIRAKGKTNRRSEAQRLANAIRHQARRERGEPCPAKPAHDVVMGSRKR